MSLEQLIEKDIIRFLDSEVKEPHQTTAPRKEDSGLLLFAREWDQDVKRALKRNDIEGAKKIFNELKQKYSEIADGHPEEKKRTYALLQDCYITIVNSLQDKVRTSALLKHMEQAPDDVFDIAVKPVDLQAVQQQKRAELPDLAPLTKDMLANSQSHPIAEQHNLSLPPPPSMGAPQSAGGDGGGMGGSVGIAPLPVFDMTKQQEVLSTARRAFERALVIGKTDPTQALELLKRLHNTIETAQVPDEVKKNIEQRIATLEGAVTAFQARKEFTAEFNALYANVARLGRMRDAQATEEFQALKAKVAAFEEKHDVYKGVFSEQMEKLQKQFSLFDEDSLVEALLPILARVKEAIQARNTAAYADAVDELQRFTRKLPQSSQKEMLERAVRALQQKAQGILASRPAKPLVQEKHEEVVDQLRPLLQRVKVAMQNKDRRSYEQGIADLQSFANRLPKGDEKTLLEHSVTQLKQKLSALTHG